MRLYDDNLATEEQLNDIRFMHSVLDSMFDWVRVIDMHGAVVFMNKAMRESLQSDLEMSGYRDLFESEELIGSGAEDFGGAARALADTVTGMDLAGVEMENDREIRVGSKVFAVITSPIQNPAGDGKAEYKVEVFRDVTRLKNLQKTILEQNDKFEYDLDMAKMLQRKLLPNLSPNPRISFQYKYMPCDMLGGDFVDIYNIGQDHLGVYIADVSGHGVAAAILTVFLRSTISKRITSPAEALNQLYMEFNKNNFESEMYITVFYAIYDLKNNILTYSNAGHNAMPILYNRQNRRDQRFLSISGIPISNWTDTISYSEQSVRVAPGDTLFLYTDGLLEIKNREKQMFGQTRVSSALATAAENDHKLLLNRMLGEAYNFADIDDKSMQLDDITMSFVEVL